MIKILTLILAISTITALKTTTKPKKLLTTGFRLEPSSSASLTIANQMIHEGHYTVGKRMIKKLGARFEAATNRSGANLLAWSTKNIILTGKDLQTVKSGRPVDYEAKFLYRLMYKGDPAYQVITARKNIRQKLSVKKFERVIGCKDAWTKFGYKPYLAGLKCKEAFLNVKEQDKKATVVKVKKIERNVSKPAVKKNSTKKTKPQDKQFGKKAKIDAGAKAIAHATQNNAKRRRMGLFLGCGC